MKNENLTRKDAIEHIEFRDRLAKELALKRREINSTRALSEEAAKKLEGTGLLAEKLEKGAQNLRRVRALGEVHIDEASHLGELRRKKTNIITEAGKRQAARNDKLAKFTNCRS